MKYFGITIIMATLLLWGGGFVVAQDAGETGDAVAQSIEVQGGIDWDNPIVVYVIAGIFTIALAFIGLLMQLVDGLRNSIPKELQPALQAPVDRAIKFGEKIIDQLVARTPSRLDDAAWDMLREAIGHELDEDEELTIGEADEALFGVSGDGGEEDPEEFMEGFTDATPRG
jgi:hypothetical protein